MTPTMIQNEDIYLSTNNVELIENIVTAFDNCNPHYPNYLKGLKEIRDLINWFKFGHVEIKIVPL